MCVGFLCKSFSEKMFYGYFGPNGILACVDKLIIFGENDILRKMHISSYACMLVVLMHFIFLSIFLGYTYLRYHSVVTQILMQMRRRRASLRRRLRPRSDLGSLVIVILFYPSVFSGHVLTLFWMTV